jgi:hypothetical protein
VFGNIHGTQKAVIMDNERTRFDLIDQEQLAAQVVAIMDAHIQHPSAEEKRHILRLAERQIESKQMRVLDF